VLFSLQPLAFYEPSVYFSIFKQALVKKFKIDNIFN